jgi:hypothetical protein
MAVAAAETGSIPVPSHANVLNKKAAGNASGL